jgi:hypothetical protein
VGRTFVSIRNLLFNVPLEHDLLLVDSRGQAAGRLRVLIQPGQIIKDLDKSGTSAIDLSSVPGTTQRWPGSTAARAHTLGTPDLALFWAGFEERYLDLNWEGLLAEEADLDEEQMSVSLARLTLAGPGATVPAANGRVTVQNDSLIDLLGESSSDAAGNLSVASAGPGGVDLLGDLSFLDPLNTSSASASAAVAASTPVPPVVAGEEEDGSAVDAFLRKKLGQEFRFVATILDLRDADLRYRDIFVQFGFQYRQGGTAFSTEGLPNTGEPLGFYHAQQICVKVTEDFIAFVKRGTLKMEVYGHFEGHALHQDSLFGSDEHLNEVDESSSASLLSPSPSTASTASTGRRRRGSGRGGTPSSLSSQVGKSDRTLLWFRDGESER